MQRKNNYLLLNVSALHMNQRNHEIKVDGIKQCEQLLGHIEYYLKSHPIEQHRALKATQ